MGNCVDSTTDVASPHKMHDTQPLAHPPSSSAAAAAGAAASSHNQPGPLVHHLQPVNNFKNPLLPAGGEYASESGLAGTAGEFPLPQHASSSSSSFQNSGSINNSLRQPRIVVFPERVLLLGLQVLDSVFFDDDPNSRPGVNEPNIEAEMAKAAASVPLAPEFIPFVDSLVSNEKSFFEYSLTSKTPTRSTLIVCGRKQGAADQQQQENNRRSLTARELLDAAMQVSTMVLAFNRKECKRHFAVRAVFDVGVEPLCLSDDGGRGRPARLHHLTELDRVQALFDLCRCNQRNLEVILSERFVTTTQCINHGALPLPRIASATSSMIAAPAAEAEALLLSPREGSGVGELLAGAAASSRNQQQQAEEEFLILHLSERVRGAPFLFPTENMEFISVYGLWPVKLRRGPRDDAASEKDLQFVATNLQQSVLGVSRSVAARQFGAAVELLSSIGAFKRFSSSRGVSAAAADNDDDDYGDRSASSAAAAAAAADGKGSNNLLTTAQLIQLQRDVDFARATGSLGIVEFSSSSWKTLVEETSAVVTSAMAAGSSSGAVGRDGTLRGVNADDDNVEDHIPFFKDPDEDGDEGSGSANSHHQQRRHQQQQQRQPPHFKNPNHRRLASVSGSTVASSLNSMISVSRQGTPLLNQKIAIDDSFFAAKQPPPSVSASAATTPRGSTVAAAALQRRRAADNSSVSPNDDGIEEGNESACSSFVMSASHLRGHHLLSRGNSGDAITAGRQQQQQQQGQSMSGSSDNIVADELERYAAQAGEADHALRTEMVLVDSNGGRFKLSQLILGEGSAGRVYLAMDVARGELVAVKALPMQNPGAARCTTMASDVGGAAGEGLSKFDFSSSLSSSSPPLPPPGASSVDDTASVVSSQQSDAISFYSTASSAATAASEVIGSSPMWAQALGREVSLLTRINHSNIVSYKSFIVTGSCAWIVIEYVASGSLEGLLATFGALSESSAAAYAVDICSGLAHLHEQNILHGDLKIANILVNDRCAKLADFGASRLLAGEPTSSSTSMLKRATTTVSAEHDREGGDAMEEGAAAAAAASATSVLSYDLAGVGHVSSHSAAGGGGQGAAATFGTPLWMAPEQARGRPSLKSDIWSLGLIALMLVTNEQPYSQIDAANSYQPLQFLFRLGTDAEFAPPPLPKPGGGFSAAFCDFVAQCLQREDEKRPSAAELLAHPWLKAAVALKKR